MVQLRDEMLNEDMCCVPMKNTNSMRKIFSFSLFTHAHSRIPRKCNWHVAFNAVATKFSGRIVFEDFFLVGIDDSGNIGHATITYLQIVLLDKVRQE